MNASTADLVVDETTWWLIRTGSIASVSYTHLDVYKRQVTDQIAYPEWSKS